jgi:hypothetical protein
MARLVRGLIWSLAAWVAVGMFWFVTTRGFHPTAGLAVIVTVSLMVACALAAYANHLILIPRYWRARRYATYAAALLLAVAVVTAAALAVIRGSYREAVGPDPDPLGVYKHYAIDFVGVLVHVAAAAVAVWVVRRSISPD